jgi:hypothetical protein
MAEGKAKTFWSGAGIVWRRQLVLWWIFLANIMFAVLGTLGMDIQVARTLDHSLSAQRLVRGFDLAAVGELLLQPEAPPVLREPGFYISSFLFAIFFLFTSGGMLIAYYRDKKPTTASFFEASGNFFWRFVRLALFFLLALIPLGLLIKLADITTDRINDRAISPYPAVWFEVGAAMGILFLAICLRLWFDMAQVIAVGENERRIRTALRGAASLLRRNFGSLFWLYFRISLLACVIFGASLQYWKNYLGPESLGREFLLAQLMIVFWLATRLWQRASEVLWYQNYQASKAAPASAPPPAD